MTKEVGVFEPDPIIGRDRLPEGIKISRTEEAEYAARWGIEVERLAGGTMAVSLNRPVPDLQEVDLTLVLRVGPNEDPPGLEGLTHMGEHMVFGGCSEVKTMRDQARRFRYNGYNIDGTTSPLDVWFDLEASSGQKFADFGIAPAVRNLASMVVAPVLDGGRFKEERKLILDEYWGNLRDFGRQSYRFVCDTVFPNGHPLRKITTGNEESLANMTADDLRQHVARYFVFANAEMMLLSHGAAVKHNQAKQLLRDTWEQLGKTGGRSYKKLDFTGLERYQPLDTQQEYVRRMDTRKGRVWLGAAQVIQTEPYSRESLALGMVEELLRTEVFAQLRGEGGYGYQPALYFNWVPYTGVGILRMGIEVEKERAGELRRKIKAIFSKMIRGAIAENLAARMVERERKLAADKPVRYKDRLGLAFAGLRNWGQVIRAEDLQKVRLEVGLSDVNGWLEKLADDPGAVFVLGDV